MEELLGEAEFWVAVGTFLLLALFVVLKVPSMATRALDARAAAIAKELEDAKKLRDEAQGLLVQYKHKTANAEAEAAAIISEAKAEAQRYAAEAKIAIAQQIERRGKVAQEKIAQAEQQAIAEVRALAADAAVAAAEKIIAARLDDKRAGDIVSAAIKEIPTKLN